MYNINEAIGKEGGVKTMYYHVSAIPFLKGVEKDLHEGTVILVPKGFDYNFVIINKLKGFVDYTVAEDFDNVYEPVLGERQRIYIESLEVEFKKRDSKPKILHQRYKTTDPSYPKFDRNDDKNRERWYRSFFTSSVMGRASYLHNWETMLKDLPDYNSKIEYNCDDLSPQVSKNQKKYK